MHRRQYLASIPLALGFSGCAGITADIRSETDGLLGGGGTDQPPRHKRIEDAVFAEANDARAEYNRPALEFDERLYETARSHSIDMAERDYFAHMPPNDNRPREYCSENLSRVGRTNSYIDAQGVANYAVAGWLDSPGHRANLLSTEWRFMAIGAAISEDWIYITQDFC